MFEPTCEDSRGLTMALARMRTFATSSSDDEIKLNVTLKKGEKFDPIEFSKWMAEIAPVFMVPRFIEVYEGGFPVTATQKIRVAEIKEITDKTWDRNKTGLKFRAR